MSDKRSSKIHVVNATPSTDVAPAVPTGLVAHKDLYRSSPTADRAYDKFIARGLQHGHDLEDWLSSEREVEDEQRAYDDGRRAEGAGKPDSRTI